MKFFISKMGPTPDEAEASHVLHDRVKGSSAHPPCSISIKAKYQDSLFKIVQKKTICYNYVKEK